MSARRALAVLLLAPGALACSDDGPPQVDASFVLESLADGVIIPAYEDLVLALDQLTGDVDAFCDAPDPDKLDQARDGWRAVATAWRHTRAMGVGPAMDRRLNATIGFLARSDSIEQLIAGSDPVDAAGIRDAGAAVKGISALEVVLFGDVPTTGADTGLDRRCDYVASVTELALDNVTQVLADWNDGHRATFVAGMDGGAQSSIDAVVNEAIFRVSEVDDQGLRALTEADRAEELSANRADGPAAFRLAELAATLDGVADLVGDGLGEPLLFELVRARSDDTATRLDRAVQEAETAMAALPDSVTAAFATPEAIDAAQEAVAALKVLLSTEIASELGVTISFSDADGDS